MPLPAGPGAPAPDIDDVTTEATSGCAGVSSMTAEVAVTGSVGGRRLRARLLLGVAAPDSARVEAFAAGQPIFVFVSRGVEATLLLTRENRVLERGRPAEILEAVAGVPLDAAQLRTTLLGCPPGGSGDSGGSRQVGSDWRRVSSRSGELYFRRASNGPWRLVAIVSRDPARPDWRAEYRDFDGALPRTARLVSSDPSRFDLRLALSQVELNAPLPQAAFDVRIPPSADPITIEELRRRGPLASSSERGGQAFESETFAAASMHESGVPRQR